MPLLLGLLWERGNKIKLWISLSILHQSNLEYFVEILYWKEASPCPWGHLWCIDIHAKERFLFHMDHGFKSSSISAVQNMHGSEEMFWTQSDDFCDLFQQDEEDHKTYALPCWSPASELSCLGESCSCTYFPCSSCYLTQKMTLKTEPGQPQCQISTGLNKILDW